jgi:hypothetical protein
MLEKISLQLHYAKPGYRQSRAAYSRWALFLVLFVIFTGWLVTTMVRAEVATNDKQNLYAAVDMNQLN